MSFEVSSDKIARLICGPVAAKPPGPQFPLMGAAIP
jgi:hypothetical protein